MKKVLALLLCLLPTIAWGQSGTPSDKSTLNTEVTTNFPDNTSGLITPAITRTSLNDFSASWQQAPRVNSTSATSYTIQGGNVSPSDYGKLIVFTASSAVAVTLPQASTTGFTTFNTTACSAVTGGNLVTITPTTSTIRVQGVAGANVQLSIGQCIDIVSDGTNYQTRWQTPQFVACAANNWVTGIVATGTTCAQPGFTNLSGTIASSQFAPASITGLTINNSPSANNDYILYFNSAANAIVRCTVGACGTAGSSGVSSLNGLTGGLTIISAAPTGTGNRLNFSAAGSTITAVVDKPQWTENCQITASVGSNLLTVALKDAQGVDPTASSACKIVFRNATNSLGTLIYDTVTAALSVNTNAVGATLGSQSSTAFRFWVVAFDNAGTVALGLFNASPSGGPQCFAIDETRVQSSTAMSSGSTSGGVFYTTAALTNKAIRILGFVEYNTTGLTTAGTYGTAPNFIYNFGPGSHRPCETVQASNFSSGLNTATTSSGFTSTVTTTTLSLASAVDPVMIDFWGNIAITSANTTGVAGLHRGSSACTTQVGPLLVNNSATTAQAQAASGTWLDFGANTLAAAYTVCVRSTDGVDTVNWGTATLPGNSGMRLVEIMG